MEALLEIYSCFFSHSIKLYVAYRYQQGHCLAVLSAKMCVQQSHGGLPFSDFKQTQIAHQKKRIRAIKTQKACVMNKNI